jgi:hypothetical protein
MALRSARHSASSALIGAAVAAVLAAGTVGAVAYVVASEHEHASLHAGAGAAQEQVGTGNRNQDNANNGTDSDAVVTPPGPRPVVDAYFEAINRREWRRVLRLGGANSTPSYRKIVDGYTSTDKDVIRSISVSGDHALVRVNAYEADGQLRVYQMYFVIQDGVIVHASQQLLTTVQVGRPPKA